MYSDASATGWGVTFGQQVSQGQWSLDEAYYHINIKEVMAVHFGLITMLSSYTDRFLTIYQGHSVRTTGASTAKRHGVPVANILQMAG